MWNTLFGGGGASSSSSTDKSAKAITKALDKVDSSVRTLEERHTTLTRRLTEEKRELLNARRRRAPKAQLLAKLGIAHKVQDALAHTTQCITTLQERRLDLESIGVSSTMFESERMVLKALTSMSDRVKPEDIDNMQKKFDDVVAVQTQTRDAMETLVKTPLGATTSTLDEESLNDELDLFLAEDGLEDDPMERMPTPPGTGLTESEVVHHVDHMKDDAALLFD